MKVRYDKLWRLMKDNKMKKSELAKAAEISSYAMTKLNRDAAFATKTISLFRSSKLNRQGRFIWI